MSLDNAAVIMCCCFQDLGGFGNGSSVLKSEGLLPFLSQDAIVSMIRGQGLRVSSTVIAVPIEPYLVQDKRRGKHVSILSSRFDFECQRPTSLSHQPGLLISLNSGQQKYISGHTNCIKTVIEQFTTNVGTANLHCLSPQTHD